jgi:hypothetical protein
MPDTIRDVLLRYIFVVFGEDKSRIYYQDIERGLFFGADTASASGKIQELDIYSANDALFAFETDMKATVSEPYMLIFQENEHPEISTGAAGSAEEVLEIILNAMGHSEESFMPYPDRGDLICVGTQFRIRVDAGGRAFYRRTDELPLPDGEEEQTYDKSELIERARVVVEDTIGKTCGNAEVFYESLETGDGDSCTVFFGYYIAGGRMYLHEDAHAARVRFTSGILAEMELAFRSFSFTGGLTKLLPEKQALAAAGGEFQLSYSDAGPETLQPSWVRFG